MKLGMADPDVAPRATTSDEIGSADPWTGALAVSRLPASQRTAETVRRVLGTRFSNDHPAFANMLASPRLDAGVLASVVACARRAVDGTEAEAARATEEVGAALARRYVAPATAAADAAEREREARP